MTSKLCKTYFRHKNSKQRIGISFFSPTDTRNGLLALHQLSEEEADREQEPEIQLLEGCEYEYAIDEKGFKLSDSGRLKDIVRPNRIIKDAPSSGRIRTGLYVGTLELLLLNANGQNVGKLPVEVRSIKVHYQDEYRSMLEFITEKSTDLILQIRSPAAGKLSPDPGRDVETIAQRFAFLQSMLGSRNFQDSLNRITVMPHHLLERVECRRTPSAGIKASGATLRKMAKGTRRIKVPATHPLYARIKTLPESVAVIRKQATLDTPENRFVKYAVTTFLTFLFSMKQRLNKLGEESDSMLNREVSQLEKQLEIILAHQFFRGISNPYLLPFGSPVLQRKGGYREILRVWLHFDAAARLVWDAGDDVFHAGRKDIAVLYEYWLFFKLLEIVEDVFELRTRSCDELIEKTADGFGLKLRAGKHIALDGIFDSSSRKLNVRFNYNRSFMRQKGTEDSDGFIRNYPAGGSWTRPMRPDYTLSLWPSGIPEQKAEELELIVHLHFDAKYRIENLVQLFGQDDESTSLEQEDELSQEKKDQRSGSFKRADLLKMHAYRDAIRRTVGAYILYPGETTRNWSNYHELLPGLGAFPIRPSANADDGSGELKKFLLLSAQHVSDRGTQRERETYYRSLIYSGEEPLSVRELTPELYGNSTKRHAPPQDTHILCVLYRNDAHLAWIQSNGLVIVQVEDECGPINLSPDKAGASYIFLYSVKTECFPGLLETSSDQKGIPEGPKVVAADTLEMKYSYPSKLKGNYYLVYRVNNAKPFEKYNWDYNKLPGKPNGQKCAEPFTVTLDELMQCSKEMAPDTY